MLTSPIAFLSRLGRPNFAIVLAAFVTLLCGCSSPSTETSSTGDPVQVFLVRHAEKAGDEGDVPLTPEGEARATELARMLKDVKLSAVYTTQYKRNADTAKPVAAAMGLDPIVIPADDLDELVQRIRSAAPSSTVLAVSHSDKLPMIAEKLGAPVAPIDHTEYDRLVLITLTGNRALATTLRFGSPSPAPQ